MGIIGDLDSYLKFQSANAMEAAAGNPGGDAAAGVGMGMGFAMANQLGKMVTEPPQAASPPPLHQEEKYYVGKNGKQAGPFDRNAISAYIGKGAIDKETLLWKQGMPQWQPAERFAEFQSQLKQTPPPLPK